MIYCCLGKTGSYYVLFIVPTFISETPYAERVGLIILEQVVSIANIIIYVNENLSSKDNSKSIIFVYIHSSQLTARFVYNMFINNCN